MRRYRLVQFDTRPVGGMRVPIGAVLDVDGRVTTVETPSRLEGTSVSAAIRSAADYSSRLLALIDSFDSLPPAFGPQVVLDAPNAIPASVDDPVGWVRRFVLG